MLVQLPLYIKHRKMKIVRQEGEAERAIQSRGEAVTIARRLESRYARYPAATAESGKWLNYIQCKENRPSCDYCSHRDLQCEWPDLQITQVNQGGAMIRKAMPAAIPATIHTQGPVFTMQDFRLFNHFIQTAYPHHPPLNDSVWTHEIPSIASDVSYSCTAASEVDSHSQYDFLLHSMLALSASDIAESNPSPANSGLECVAISHRVKAISSLNEAIGKPIASMEQGNAMIATCFSLLFQSTLIDDGLVEYMTFIRGVVVVSMHMGQRDIGFLFNHMFDQAEIVLEELTESPLIDPDHARRACRSLELLFPLIQNTREKEYYGYLLSAARALFTSSGDGMPSSFPDSSRTDTQSAAYSNLAKIYGLFSYSMSHDEFALFIDPSNEAGKLLQSHFAALQIIMTPFTRRETDGRRRAVTRQSTDGTTARWLVALHQDIKSEIRPYYEWPIWVQDEMAAGRLRMSWE